MPFSMGSNSREYVNHLVKDLVSHTLANNNLSVEGFVENSQPSSLEAHVRHTVDALVGDSPELFTNIGEQLHMTHDNIQAIFFGISDEIFVTGINWGRIVAFLAFGGSVATYCASREELNSYVNQVVLWMTDYIEHSLKVWIQLHGGWDGFTTFFKLPGEENAFYVLDLKRWSLFALAGFGFGALLAMAASHQNF